MRKITRAFTGSAAAALALGMAGPALAATQARPLERVPAHAAFQPGSGQSVIDWNRELITLPGTPGQQPATIHPTRSFASLQAAADEAGLSRIFAGQHTLLDHQAGQALGRQVGEFTLRHLRSGHPPRLTHHT
jgi:hypothetical protein